MQTGSISTITNEKKDKALGTIHLRRRHVLGGRGQKIAKFADG